MKGISIITGSARGIGKAIATKCVVKGMNVAIVDVDYEAAKKTATELNSIGNGKAIAYKVDVTNYDQVLNMVKDVLRDWETIHSLVNNAGILSLLTNFEDETIEGWKKVIDVNLMGTVNCCKAILPEMKKNNFGRIVNMSSLSAFTGGSAVTPAYAASKAAIASITRSIAKQVAHMGINVNTVSPGLISTEMTIQCNYSPEAVPAKRLGTPEDVANGVYFLLSSEAEYITGINLDINGGILMR